MNASTRLVVAAACVLLILRTASAQPRVEADAYPRLKLEGFAVGEIQQRAPADDAWISALPPGASDGSSRFRVRNWPARAAEMDPRIVIEPDPSIDARILKFVPKMDVDPEMIIPRGSPSA